MIECQLLEQILIKAYVMCEASPRWKMMNDFGIG